MTTPLTPINAPRLSEQDRITLSPRAAANAPSFEQTLGAAVEKVSKLHAAAEVQTTQFASSTNGQLHENMIALEKANIALRMMVSVRNRVVEAYRDLMHMS